MDDENLPIRAIALCVPAIRIVIVAVYDKGDGTALSEFIPVVAIRSSAVGYGDPFEDLIILDDDWRVCSASDRFQEIDHVSWRPILCPWPHAEDVDRLGAIATEIRNAFVADMARRKKGSFGAVR